MHFTPLWPASAPQASGNDALDIPALTDHLPPAERATGAAVIVAPGGGYRILASDHEGLQVARWLNRQGIAAFVLRYRLGEKYHSDVSLLDGLRAVRTVRAKASSAGIDPNRIGMLGFSAGGHLTTAVGVAWDGGNPADPDPIERVSSRPDFLVPVYAVVNGELRGRKALVYTPTETRVNADTPPAFIVATHEDSIVPANQSGVFYEALRQAEVQAELHIFGHGDHGFGLCDGDPDYGEWPQMLHRWLRTRGLLTASPRIAVEGNVTLDGKALGMLWLTLTPTDPGAPVARVKFSRTQDGAFAIPADRGPVAGAHTARVSYLSDQFPHAGDGRYTVDDVTRFEREVEIRPNVPLDLALDSDEALAASPANID